MKCRCGCGRPAPIAKTTDARWGHVKGEPVDFIRGHNNRGAGNPAWNGGTTRRGGYVAVKVPDHPRSDPNGYVLEHVLVAESALGRPLPEGAEVHHVNEVKTDNRPENLVICEDHAYHMLLHRRARAHRASGRAGWRKCPFCKRYDDPRRMYVAPDGRQAVHRECQNQYWRQNYGSEAQEIRCAS